MIQPPGDNSEAYGGLPNLPALSASKGSNAEIRLICTLIADGNPETREQLLHLSHMRGHDVAVLETLESDLEKSTGPVELLIVHLSEEHGAALEQLIRRMLRVNRDHGIVVMGVVDTAVEETCLERWLQVGVNNFIAFSDGTWDAQLLAAEHHVRRNRTRMDTQKQIAESMKRYETLFLSSPDAQLIITAKDNRILDASPKVSAVLGLRREELTGRYLSLIFPDLFRKDDLVRAGEESTRLEQPVTVSSIPYRRPDGSKCLLDATVSRVSWSDDAALAVTLADVTITRARNERRLRAAKLDTVSSMAGGVADDISNLLTAVRGNLSLIGKQPTLGRDARELLHDAEIACNSADKLVGCLRILSRSNIRNTPTESTTPDPRKRRTALNHFLERLISFELLGTHIQPSYELDQNLWHVDIDEARIEEALKAIVKNAKEAMPSGGQLRILATNYEPQAQASKTMSASYVLVSIVDDGHGVPKEHLGQLFDPYFSTRPDHAGLGLALSQAIVRTHGGIIDVEHAPVRGTVVRIYLPAAMEQDAISENGLAIPPTRTDGVDVPNRRRRVLVMDDDKDIRIITKKILASHGFDVYCTQDGREAIEVFRKAQQMKAPFDVALFDLDVRGGMGGKDAVARLRRDYPDIKVILMTGFVDDILLENHREHGFSGVITKPFQIDKLIATITQFAEAGRQLS
ncbi:MAG: response regulator [Verrucomicrobia bacterium]|nr:response regulator [Verrucomicrobiota bacterium]